MRYGGSSSAKPDGAPLATVKDSSFDTASVSKTQTSSISSKISATSIELRNPNALPAKNIIIIAISIGNLPLQGIKLFVNTAISLSFGFSMIRQPVTPQALQPMPIAMLGLRERVLSLNEGFPVDNRFMRTLDSYPITRWVYQRGFKLE